MADTVLQVAEEGLDQATAEYTRARDALAAAEGVLQAAQAQLAADTAARGDRLDEIADLRRRIALTTNAADGEALFGQLEERITALRTVEAAVTDDTEAIAEAQSRIGALQAELERTTVAKVAATAEVVAETAAAVARAAWSTAVSTAPLKDLPKKADVTIAGGAKTAFDAATARLKGDLTNALFARAHDRRTRRITRLAAVDAAAVAADDALADAAAELSLGGQRARAALAFARVEEDVKRFALTAQERYDRALALLVGVTSAPALSVAEAARISELATAAGGPDAAHDAFAAEVTRDTAVADLELAQRAVDTARLAAAAAHPGADVEADADVVDAKNELPAKTTALGTAQTALNALVGKLDALETAVPDAAWDAFDDYEDAAELLAGLAAFDPATRPGDLTDAETEYAGKLEAERDAAAVVAALGELVRVIDDRSATAAQTRPVRLLEALRGDA